MAGAGAVRAGSAFVEFFGDDSALIRSMRQSERKLRRFGQNISAIGRTFAGIGLSVGLPVALATRGFASFEDQLLTIRAITGASEADFAGARGEIEELGRTTAFTATQVAEAGVVMARAGFSLPEIQEGLRGVLLFSRATGTDLAIATGIAANAMNTFGLSASQIPMIADTLAASANAANQTVEDVGEAMQYLGASAKSVGIPLSDAAASVAVLARNGIAGASAGTALARAISAFSQGAKAAQVKEAFGVDVADANKNLRPLADIFEEINARASKMGNLERLGLMTEIFGERGKRAAILLMSNVGALRELEDQLAASVGTAERMEAVMESGLGGAMRRLLSALEGVRNAFIDAFQAPLMQVMDTLTASIAPITAFIASHKGLVVGLVAGIAGLTAAGFALIAFGQVMIGVAGIMGIASATVAAFGAVMSIVLSPVGLLVSGLVAAGAAWLAFIDQGNVAAAAFSHTFSNVLTHVTTSLKQIVAALMAGDIQEAWRVAVQGLGNIWEDVLAGMQIAWKTTVNWFAGLWDTFTLDFTQALLGALEVVAKATAAWAGRLRNWLPFESETLARIELGARGFAQTFQEQAMLEEEAAQARAKKREEELDALRRRARGFDLSPLPGREGQGIPKEITVEPEDILPFAPLETLSPNMATPEDIIAAAAGATGPAGVEGAFSAFARFGGGFSTPMERVAEKMQDIDEGIDELNGNLGEIASNIRRGHLKFTGALPA